jgi:hypothetical protein
MTRQEKLSSTFVKDWVRKIPHVETGPQNHYTVNFTDGTSLTAHGDSAPAVFDLWKEQEKRIGKTVKNVYLKVTDETDELR